MMRGLNKVYHRLFLISPSSLCPPLFPPLKLCRFSSLRTPGHLRTHSSKSLKTNANMTNARLHHVVPINSVAPEDGGSNGSVSSSASNPVATEDEGTLQFYSFCFHFQFSVNYEFELIIYWISIYSLYNSFG